MQKVSAPLGSGGLSNRTQPWTWESILWTKVVPFLLLVNIALNPFPHYTTYREVSYYTALALLPFYLLRHSDWRAFRTPFTLPGALFTAWACLGLLWALDFGGSLHDIRAHLLKYIGLFLLVTTFFNGRDKIHLLLWVIILSVLISGWHDIYTFYGVGKNSLWTRMLIPDHQLPVGPMGFMALFALLLAIHLYRCGGKGGWERWVLSLAMAGLLVILLATQMRSLLVALPIVVIVLCWDNKKVLGVVLLGVVFCSLATLKLRMGAAYNDRLTLNYISFLMIKEHPLTGIGFSMETPGDHALIDHERLRAQVPEGIRHHSVEHNNPHNMWLELTIRLGVVGPLLFLAVLVAGARTCILVMRQGGREQRLLGQLCLSLLLLFPVYGHFNVVFMHVLELLLSVLFGLIAILYFGVQEPGAARSCSCAFVTPLRGTRRLPSSPSGCWSFCPLMWSARILPRPTAGIN